MFRSIQYRLVSYLILLILSVGAAVWCGAAGKPVYAVVAALAALYAICMLWRNYRKFNINILFLLNALENGDYSFHFSETKLSRRERELNAMMNRIKDILISARQSVIQNERFMSLIVESVSTGIVIVQENGSVRLANASALRLLGVHVLTHIRQLSNIEPRLTESVERMSDRDKLQIKIPNEREEVLISVGMTHVDLNSGPTRIITLTNINNELEAMEMESWVKLIRVMTHEIMNSIAPISSLSDTLLFNHRHSVGNTLPQGTLEALQTINTTSKGLLTFVESYRKFTGIPKPDLQQLQLDTLLTDVARLESGVLRDMGIQIEIQSGDNEIVVWADRAQITQVLVNLVKNAAESFDDNDTDKKIILESGRLDDRPYVAVSNNGKPISQEDLPHIFVPFFTTKSSGSGIGLSVSRYIMRLHGGNLTHHHSGGWTVFRMTF